MTARHIYVDETKERGFVLVASVHLGPDVDAMRKVIRKLVLPGQSRIHMAKERDGRRKEIIGAICAAGVQATIYDAARRYGDVVARTKCLQGLVDDVGAGQPTLLVLEQDDSLVEHDRRFLYAAVRAAGLQDHVRYEHHRAKSELLLTVPDAVAWCWARGGSWRELIRSITTIKEV